MPLVVKDRVRETSVTAGTGTITLAGAVNGFQSFSVIGNGNTTYYTIVDPLTNEWEVGIGTYTSSGTTLSRDTILESSTGGTAVNFSSNSKDVFVTYPAERSVYVDGSTITPATAATLPVLSGGTGQTSYTDGQLLIGNTATTGLNKATLTAGSNVTITNGNGTITIASTNPGGDVVGPASATDNAIARFDGTTGKLIQNSAVTIADDGATVISVDSATDALRITQIGAGNALLVEDSANPDATPTVITAAGRVVVGYTAGIAGVAGVNSQYQQHGTTNAGASAGFYDWQNVAIAGPIYNFNKSKSGTIGTRGIVASGDRLGTILFGGDDGTNFITAGQISCLVDGTPGTNDMPGRLTFSTTADGASTPTERMRIDSAGNVGIATLTPGSALDVKGTLRLSGSSSGYVGLAPAAAAGSTTYTLPSADGTTGQVLSTNGSGTLSWATAASGTGDVVGPASATDNAIVRFDGTTGKLVQNSGVVVDDSGNVGVGIITPSAPINVYNATTSQVLVQGDSSVSMQVERYSTDTSAPGFTHRKARGTLASPLAVASGDTSGQVTYAAYGGTNFRSIAAVRGTVNTYTDDDNISGDLSFLTRPAGAGAALATQMTITSTGNVGIGTSSPGSKLTIEDTGASGATFALQTNAGVNHLLHRASTDVSSPTTFYRKSRGTLASPTAVATNDNVGSISFQGYGGTNNRTLALVQTFVENYTSDTNLSGYILFATTNAGTTAAERLRISANGTLTSQATYDNTATGSTVVVTSAGLIRRTSSSIKYKKDVEDLNPALVTNAVENLRPVWYRTKNAEGDDKASWSHVGLIAEEVALVEPRLVRFRTSVVTEDEEGKRVESPLDTPEPEDVDYGKLSVLLLAEIKTQRKTIEELTKRIEALENNRN